MPAAPSSRLQLRAGSIKRVKLIDFMCHSELAVDFRTQVSFVTGHNGSGKSAILAAIVAGLGARANVTSRGGKLSDLIKHGEKSATVTIYLHNEGTNPAPYKPEEYGDTIEVERVFHLEKSAAYTIRSAKGKVISKKRKELGEILDHFNIQVENPVFLMNQDTCRSFLNSKTGKELYGFFYKAPLLDNLEATVATTRQKVEEGRAVVAQKVEEAHPLEEAIAVWKKKQDQCIRPETVEADIANAELKLRIKDYHLLLHKAQDAEEALKDAEAQLQEHEARAAHGEAKLPKLQERLKGMREDKEGMTPEMAVSQQALDSSKPKMAELRKATVVAQQALSDASDNLKAKQRSLQKFEQQLEDARNQQDLRDFDSRKIELENQIQQTRMGIDECRTNRNASEGEKKQLERQFEENRTALSTFNNSYEAIKRGIQELDRDIGKYKDSGDSSNTLNRLGDLAVRQRAVIDNLVQKKALRGRIIGPCAAQLNLTEEVYAKAVEKSVGAFLTTYVLEDERDRQVVTNAFHAQRIPAPALDCSTGSGGKFSETEMAFNDACRAPHPSVSDLLTFKHPHVRNVLVDALDLHRIIVMPTIDSARKHYREEAGFPNCKHILDIQGNHHSKDSDGYQFIPNGRTNTVSLLSADFASQIGKLKDERDAKAAVLRTKEAERAEFTIKANQLKDSIAKKSADIRKLQDEETKLQTRLTSFENDLEAAKSIQPTDIQVVVEEVDELKAAIAVMTEEITTLEAAYQKAKAKEAKAEANFTKMKEQARDEVKQVEDLTSGIEQLELKIAEKESELRNAKRTFTALENTVAQRQAEWTEATEECQRMKDQFLGEGVQEKRLRTKVKETQDQLELMIDKMKASLRNLECDYENSWERCRDKLAELTKQKTEVEGQLVQAQEAVELMDKNARIRENNFLTSRAKASEILQKCFEHLMQESASRYEGQIELEHESKTLKFNVKAKTGSGSESGTGAGSNVKSLSGGERSYTMVCFLVALWQLIEIPFRVLDEFDVFMDMINRDTAMTRLIHSAVESQRQFIFLTPLAFSQEVLDDFKNNELVAIVRMPEARVMDDAAAQR